jgi:hypothetical protein
MESCGHQMVLDFSMADLRARECQEHTAALADRLTRVEPEVSLSSRKS